MNARHGTPGNNRLSNNAGQQRVDFMFSAARTNNSTAEAAKQFIPKCFSHGRRFYLLSAFFSLFDRFAPDLHPI